MEVDGEQERKALTNGTEVNHSLNNSPVPESSLEPAPEVLNEDQAANQNIHPQHTDGEQHPELPSVINSAEDGIGALPEDAKSEEIPMEDVTTNSDGVTEPLPAVEEAIASVQPRAVDSPMDGAIYDESFVKASPTQSPPPSLPPTSQHSQPQTNYTGPPAYTTRYILSGHTRSISAIKFSPDGNLLASCAADKVVKIWDALTGEIIHTFSGHKEGVSDVAWSTDGDFLASASDDKTICIWSMETMEVAKTLHGHTNFVFCVNFGPKSNLLVSGGFDETVRIWDVARGKSLKTLPAHSDPVTAVTFNHDGTLIASCAMDGLIRIWDTDSGQCLKTLADDDNPICSHIKFTPNSRFILAATQDSTIRLWNIQTSRCAKTYTGHTNRTYSIFADIAPGGMHIVSGSEDNKVYLWDLQTRQIAQMLEGHRDVVITVASHPFRPIIASASMEKDLTIRLWHNEPASRE